MKKLRINLVFVFLAVSLLVTACSALPVPNSPGASVSQDTVYIAYTNSILAVDPVTGSQKWRYPATIDAGRQFFTPPAASADLVVAGSITNVLYGLDPNSGAEKWNFTDAKGHWVSGALIVNKTVLAPNGDGTLYALSLEGKLLWKYPGRAAFWATPVSDGKLVYLPGQDHYLYAINIASGLLVWEKDLGAASLYTPILTPEGTIYLSTLGGKVLSVSSSNGNINWTFPVKGNLWGSPVLLDGNLYVADQSSKAYAINASTGASVGEWDAPGPVAATGAVFAKGVIFVTEAGDVFGVTDKGEKFFNQKISGKLYTQPMVIKDQLVISVLQGEKILVAYDATGKEVWSLPVPK